MNLPRPLRFAFAVSVACLFLAGCHVRTRDNGSNKDVDIGTPFGSMKVKTNDKANDASLGITAYPGATPAKDNSDTSSANVNMSFGNFHLGVVAEGLQTSDSQDKVIAFYKKDLARYGEVIQCKGDTAIGSPTRTSQGLTCSDNDKRHVNANNSEDDLELRAGSPMHQHIVGIKHQDGGTRIGLVKLDLPTGLDTDKES